MEISMAMAITMAKNNSNIKKQWQWQYAKGITKVIQMTFLGLIRLRPSYLQINNFKTV